MRFLFVWVTSGLLLLFGCSHLPVNPNFEDKKSFQDGKIDVLKLTPSKTDIAKEYPIYGYDYGFMGIGDPFCQFSIITDECYGKREEVYIYLDGLIVKVRNDTKSYTSLVLSKSHLINNAYNSAVLLVPKQEDYDSWQKWLAAEKGRPRNGNIAPQRILPPDNKK